MGVCFILILNVLLSMVWRLSFFEFYLSWRQSECFEACVPETEDEEHSQQQRRLAFPRRVLASVVSLSTISVVESFMLRCEHYTSSLGLFAAPIQTLF